MREKVHTGNVVEESSLAKRLLVLGGRVTHIVTGLYTPNQALLIFRLVRLTNDGLRKIMSREKRQHVRHRWGK
jgi:hypothetical protein